jgi:hypothetical protein
MPSGVKGEPRNLAGLHQPHRGPGSEPCPSLGSDKSSNHGGDEPHDPSNRPSSDGLWIEIVNPDTRRLISRQFSAARKPFLQWLAQPPDGDPFSIIAEAARSRTNNVKVQQTIHAFNELHITHDNKQKPSTQEASSSKPRPSDRASTQQSYRVGKPSSRRFQRSAQSMSHGSDRQLSLIKTCVFRSLPDDKPEFLCFWYKEFCEAHPERSLQHPCSGWHSEHERAVRDVSPMHQGSLLKVITNGRV